MSNKSKLFVGNLDFSVTEEEVRDLFSQVGTVLQVNLPKDFATGRGRGFGFVAMASVEEAQKAIEQLNNYEFKDKKINVNIAKEKKEFQRREREPFKKRY